MIVLLNGYIDESYNDKVFTLACSMSNLVGWADIERGWKKCLAAKNKDLLAANRPVLSRYHAAHCSSLIGEFAGWSVAEQIEFTKQLHGTFRRGRAWTNTIAYTLPIADFIQKFPGIADNPLPACYGEMLKFVMMEMASQVIDAKKSKGSLKQVHFALIHERCPYDGILMKAFNTMLADECFEGSDMFTTIAPLGWENCIPLQVADMLAYESFKDADRKITGRKRRKSLEALLSTRKFGGRSKSFSEESIQDWRNILDSAKSTQI